MRSREIIMRKLEQIDSNIVRLNFLLKQGGNRDEFQETLNITSDIINECKDYIQLEPVTGNEINKIN